MLAPELINPMEMSLIAKIKRDETWLLGEKMGHEVDPRCKEVVSKVIEIILQLGAQWRINFENVSPAALSHQHFVSTCRSEKRQQPAA